MRDPITTEEQSTTAATRLAYHIEFAADLHLPDVEDIIDAGLANEADFGPDNDPDTYSYRGDRWVVEFRSGRPHLIEAINVPPDAPGPAVAAAERGKALAVYMTETLFGSPMSEPSLAEASRDPWERILREAAEKDAAQTVTAPGDQATEP